MSAPSTSWKRSAGIVVFDLRRLISFYLARFMVRRTLIAERKAAQRNFKKLRKTQTAAQREQAVFWFFLR